MISKTLEVTKKFGIHNCLEIIVGFPYETEKDIESTESFLLKNQRLLDMIFLSPFKLYPGSTMDRNPEMYGIQKRPQIKSLKKVLKLENIEYKYPFDEVNGLKWEKKSEQRNKFRHRLDKVCDKINAEKELNFMFYN
jgi:radical SAM superfamily enzyme YgiQ (UPF0313 family)